MKFLKKFFNYLANFLRTGTTESTMRLLCFITVVSGNIAGLGFMTVIWYRLFIGKNNVDLVDASVLVGAIAAWIGVGIAGKYYGSKAENQNNGTTNNGSGTSA